jgi:serine O-acetyltransferase
VTPPQYSWKTVRDLIRSDVERYTYLLQDELSSGSRNGRLLTLKAFFLCQGLQATAVYRVSHKIFQPGTGGVFRPFLVVLQFLMQRYIEITTGISISPRARIGRGFYIGHFGGVVIGPVEIGEHCNVSHGVTIGRGVARGSKGRPTLGNRVWIGPGAKILGPVFLGNDSAIGANAVVRDSVPARALAVGVPAVVHPERGSFDVLVYDGMETDAERAASLDMMRTNKGAAAPEVELRWTDVTR